MSDIASVARSTPRTRITRIVVSPFRFFRDALTLNVTGPFDRWMLHEEVLVHLDADARCFERPYVAVLVDRVGRTRQLIAEQIVLRHIALEVSAVVDRAE